MTPKLKSIDHVHVFVTDRKSARIWYEAVLGMRPLPSLEFWAEDGGPLTISDSGGNIHIALFEAKAAKCRSTIAFNVDATEFIAWKGHLSDAVGKQLRVEDHQITWSLYFSDPDGNPYEITCSEYEVLASRLRAES
jgi:catechol-2,3-dioxygenase